MNLSGDASPIDPGEAATREFSRARKGYNPTEVRVHITRLTDEIRRLRGQEAALEAQLELARSSQSLRIEDLDPTTISRALGEETVRIIDTAREASEEIRSKAEEKAATVVREAHERANALTSEAAELRDTAARETRELIEQTARRTDEQLAEATAEAERLVADARGEADTIRSDAQAYADKVRSDIEAQAALAEENSDQLRAEGQAVLDEARAEATEIRSAAHADAEVVRSDAEALRARREAEAEAAAAEIHAEVERLRAAARAEADALVAAAHDEAEQIAVRATADAEAEVERAREVGRSMIAETQEARERMIHDLAERRHAARQQLEALRAGRERLLDAFATARLAFDGLTDDVVVSLQDARAAADQAARLLPDDTDEAAEKLGRLIAAGANDTELFDAELASGDEPPVVDYIEVAGLAPSAMGEATAETATEEPASVPTATELDEAGADDEAGAELDALLAEGVALEAAVAEALDDYDDEDDEDELADVEADDDDLLLELDDEEDDEDELADVDEEEDEDDDEDADEDDEDADEDDESDADDEGEDDDESDEESDEDEDDEDLRPAASGDAEFGRLRLVSSNVGGPSPIGIEALTGGESEEGLSDEGRGSGEAEPAAAVVEVEALFARLRADHDDDDDDHDDEDDDDVDEGGDEGDDLAAVDDDTPLAAVTSIASPATVIDLAAYEQDGEAQAATVAVLTSEADVALAHQDLLDERDEAIGELLASVGRRIRRVVADQENEVLDLIRRNRKAKTAEQILPTLAEQHEAYRSAVGPDFAEVIAAGVEFAQVGWHNDAPDAKRLDATLDAVFEQLDARLIEPLIAKLGRIIANTDDTTPDRVDLVDAVRRGYREFKGDRLGEVAGDLVTYAYSSGVLAAAKPGQSTCWIVDHSGRPCPDGEDNSLAGPVAVGDEFPTGDVCPPVHSGCRCLLVPATR